MKLNMACGVLAIGLIGTALTLPAQTPDVMILVDGEKLIGHFESADSTNVTFKSDLAGEVKVPWAKIQELKSSGKFAVAKKGQTFGRREKPDQVPQGTVSLADQKVLVNGSGPNPTVIPVSETQNVIPQDSFLRAFARPKLSEFWSGTANFGAALVQATQTSRTFTGGVALVRTVPSESWISPRYRTTVDLQSAYGTTTSAGTTVKTNILHAGVEQDEYVNAKLFFLVDAAFDHNFSQGLSLQQTYSGGLGWVAYKAAKQELDLKGQIAYISQDFASGPKKNLVGAVATETYNRSLIHGANLHQELSVVPSFNQPAAYTANFLLNLGVPLSKKFNVTAGFQDSYLNTPSPDFKKNSLLFSTALTYKIN